MHCEQWIFLNSWTDCAVVVGFILLNEASTVKLDVGKRRSELPSCLLVVFLDAALYENTPSKLYVLTL